MSLAIQIKDVARYTYITARNGYANAFHQLSVRNNVTVKTIKNVNANVALKKSDDRNINPSSPTLPLIC